MLDDCHQNFFFQIVHGSYLGFVGRLALGAWRLARRQRGWLSLVDAKPILRVYREANRPS